MIVFSWLSVLYNQSLIVRLFIFIVYCNERAFNVIVSVVWIWLSVHVYSSSQACECTVGRLNVPVNIERFSFRAIINRIGQLSWPAAASVYPNWCWRTFNHALHLHFARLMRVLHAKTRLELTVGVHGRQIRASYVRDRSLNMPGIYSLAVLQLSSNGGLWQYARSGRNIPADL